MTRCHCLLLLTLLTPGGLAACTTHGGSDEVVVVSSDTVEPTGSDDAGSDAASDADAVLDTGETGDSGDLVERDAADTVDAEGDSIDEDVDEDMGLDLEGGCEEADTWRLVEFDVAASADIFRDRWIKVLYSAASFRAYTGQEPPDDLDFTTEWVAVIGSGGWYGEFHEIGNLTFCEGSTRLDMIHVEAGDDCERTELITWGGLVVRFPAVDGASMLNMSGSRSGSHVEFTCDMTSPSLGAECTHLRLCQPGLVCGGLTRGRSGICVSPDALVEVEREHRVPVADGESSPTVSTIMVSGVSGTLADVVVEVWIAHPSPSDVQIALRSPTGEREVIWDHETSRDVWESSTAWAVQRAAVKLSAADVAGAWQLEIIDDVAGNIGQLEGWRLKLVAR